MTTYQDVVAANQALWAWALVEPSGLDFAPYIGSQHLTGHGSFLYQQSGPFPTSEALKANTNGWLTVPFPLGAAAPWWVEFWVKLPSATPAVAQNMLVTGVSGSSSTSIYIATNGHIHINVVGVTDFDTGFVWPNTAWHLVQVGHIDNTGGSVGFAFDGVQVSSHSIVGATFAANSLWSIGADVNGVSPLASALFSFVAVYPGVLSGPSLLASFVAASNAAGALVYARSANNSSDTLLLQSILAAVQKTFPTT